MDIFLEVVSKKTQPLICLPSLQFSHVSLWVLSRLTGVISPSTTSWVNVYIFIQQIPPSKKTFILPFKSSVFAQWIILNAGWGKNHRARPPPPVITRRGEGLRNGVGRSHTFFWRCIWLLPCHRVWSLFSLGEVMKPFKHIVYLCNKWHPTCSYQLQSQTLWKCRSRAVHVGYVF